ncbi:hypothetical protein ACFQH3_16200 [Haladaptatus sp. GCM10025707]|uniref:DUF7504 family protein n=1 Tax=Haladaptatus sp. GCM10025707 TaxID=3252658 RepID=UPI003619AD7D
MTATSTLLCAPPMEPAADDACMELLTPQNPAETNVLWVAYSRSPDSCLTQWHRHGAGRPNDLAIINVGDSVRSAAAASTAGENPQGPIQTVASAGDLTGLGIKISEVLTRWADQDAQIVVCFDSLTTLLQYVDPEKAYEFLHVLTGRLFAADAIAHFHINPGAHDDQTLSMIRSLFDGDVSLTEDGERTVRTR